MCLLPHAAWSDRPPVDAPAPLVLPSPPAPGRGGASYGRAVELFIGRTRHTRTGSPHTERAYRADLRHFGAYLTEQRLPYADVARREAEAYLVVLSAEHAARTVQRRVSCVRGLYRFLQGIGIVKANPFVGLDLPSFDRKSETHKVLSDAELERAVAALAHDVAETRDRWTAIGRGPGHARAFAAHFTAARRRATATLMAFGGLRCGEVLGMTVEAFVQRPDGFSLAFTGKGAKRRTVPLAGAAYPALHDWLAVRRHVPARTDRVFVTLSGLPVDPAQVRRECNRLGERVGTRVRLSPHVLRRTFATRTLRASGDLRGVQDLLGHAQIGTTEIYTHVDDEGLRDLVESTALALPPGIRDPARGPIARPSAALPHRPTPARQPS